MTANPCRILVVDDDGAFRESMRRLLWMLQERIPSELVQAANGREAHRVVQRQPVDCVLLDHRMPGGTGLEWIPRLGKKGAAVVMVTGEGDEALAVQAMKSGAADYLVKGAITPEALARAIATAVEKQQMRSRLEQQRRQLMIAERHRVMIESLGSVCHHLSQPMTTVTAYLEIMSRQETFPAMQKMIQECAQAVEGMNAVLRRLQEVSEYRTEPYLRDADGGVRILSI